MRNGTAKIANACGCGYERLRAQFQGTQQHESQSAHHPALALRKAVQLVVSPELAAEYLEIFAEVLGMEADTIDAWRVRFEHDSRCTVVHLARRYTENRDPDDNILFATALVGRAEYLITNDRDLLDLPEEFRRSIPFAILKPEDFLKDLGRIESGKQIMLFDAPRRVPSFVLQSGLSSTKHGTPAYR